jgi:hypothetical protein
MTSVPLLRRACLQAVDGFDEELPACHDLDLWIRLSQRYAFTSVDDVLVEHRIHPDQMTADLPRKVLAKEAILAKHGETLRAHPDLHVRSLMRLAFLHFAAGTVDEGRRRIEDALRIEPNNQVLQRHLQACTADAEAHRAAVLRDEFGRVGNVTLYY